MLLPYTCNASSGGSFSSFYRGLIERKCDDFLGVTLGLDDTQLSGLFRMTFGTGPLEDFQNSLAWQCYRWTLPRFGASCLPRCGMFRQNYETVLHAIVQRRLKMWIYVEQLLSYIEGMRLSSESLIKIVPPSSFDREGKFLFFSLRLL